MALLIFLSTFFIFAQGYDGPAQCRVEFLSQPPTLTTTSYIHPTEFVKPAVLKQLVEPISQTPMVKYVPETNNYNYLPNPPSIPPIVIGRDDDDDFRSILYLLIFALGKQLGKGSSSCGNGCSGCKGGNNFGENYWFGGNHGNDGWSCGGGCVCGGCHNGENFGFEQTYEIVPTYDGDYNIVVSPGFGGNSGCGGGCNCNGNCGLGVNSGCGGGCNNIGNSGFGGNSACQCGNCNNCCGNGQFKYDNFGYEGGNCGCGCHTNTGINELTSVNGVTYIPYPIIVPTNCACSCGHNNNNNPNLDNCSIQTTKASDSNEINLRIITDK